MNTNKKSSQRSSDEECLLKNSASLLTVYRETQSRILKRRLDFFVKTAVAGFGSVDNIKKTGTSPIDSKRDIDMIERLVELKTFATIPVFSDDGKSVTHFYTIGMWYYWGLPELVVKFDSPLKEMGNIDFTGIFINIIHDNLFYKYKNVIINENSNNVNHVDFRKEPTNIYLSLDGFDMNVKLKKVKEEDYMSLKAYFMLWFYMYYMEAETDDKGEPILYPVYQIDIESEKYPTTCKKITDALMESALSKLNDSDKNNKDDETSSVLSDIPEETDGEINSDVDELQKVENLDNVENLDKQDE